jgi:uncharacterized repeat protein (TIGR01451 family)
MKPRIKKPLIAVAAVAVLSLAVPQATLAIGTGAGVTISNTATVDYEVGGINQTDIPSSPAGNSDPAGGVATTFLVDNKVDNKVNLLTAELAAAPTLASPGQTNAVFAFNVSNTGNTTQDYSVVATELGATNTVAFGGTTYTDDMAATITGIMVDANDNGTMDDAVFAGTAGTISGLQPSVAGTDSSRTVWVLATMPLSAVDGSTSVISLSAATYDAGGGLTASNAADAWDTTTVQVVFADEAGSDDVARDGTYSARGAYVVASALLTVTKSADVISDPFTTTGNPKAIPGAVIEYTVEINNSGSDDADSVILTDVLPATLGTPVTISGGTSSAYNSTTNTVTINFGTIGAGAATETATIRAVIQ